MKLKGMTTCMAFHAGLHYTSLYYNGDKKTPDKSIPKYPPSHRRLHTFVEWSTIIEGNIQY